jgi:hypothetical protein
MGLFEPYIELNDRTIEIINYNEAAINISFFKKHKYKVNRDPDPEEIQN